MILYKYQTKVEKLDPNGSYFMPDDMWFATKLLNDGLYSTEVNLINYFKNTLEGKVDDKNFIDIGANVGTYTMILAPIFNHTYAFEPNKHIYNIMCGNMALYNLSDKTTLINMGLSDKEEELKYNLYDELGGNNTFTKDDSNDISQVFEHGYDMVKNDYRHTERLKVKTLDSFNIQNVGLIKIDVEGFELNVLKGAVKTIEQSNYPTLIIESWNVEKKDTKELAEAKETLRLDLFNFIMAMGYKLDNNYNDIFIFKH